jgi:HAAS domain-containing protein
MSAIDRYLRELERELRVGRRRRRRILAEAEDHLREAAREAGEEAAVARFGAPREVARRFAEAAAGAPARLAAQLLAVALALAFLALYPIPEQVLPPAPWPGDQPPQYLHWKQEALVALFLVAAPTGIAAFVLARGYRLHAALSRRVVTAVLALAGTCVLALAAALVLGVILAYQWHEAVPGSPGVGWIAALATVQALLLAAGAIMAARAAVAAGALRRR